MYFYQSNNGEIEICKETTNGFEWICDCGSDEKQESWNNAIMITQLLNNQQTELPLNNNKTTPDNPLSLNR